MKQLRILIFVAAILLTATHALAADITRCTELRDKIRSTEKVQSDVMARLEMMKPRLDSLSKQIDDLSIKEANDYLDRGAVNPDTERQLAQLRTEYKKLSQSDRDTLTSTKRVIASYQEQMKSEGCPTPNAAEPTKKASSAVAQPAPALDTSKMTGAGTNAMYFEDASGHTMHFTAPADYRWMTVGGMFGGDIPGPNHWTWFDCPVRTGSGTMGYSYKCNVSMKIYDPASTTKSIVRATGHGEATASVYVTKDHKGDLFLHVDRLAIVNTTVTPPTQKTFYHIDYHLHEVGQ